MDVTWSDQCIVFDLPSGAGGMAAGMYKTWVLQHIREFTRIHFTDYRTITHRYELKIWFPDDKYLTLFLLWYTPGQKQWRKPYIIREKYPDEKTT